MSAENYVQSRLPQIAEIEDQLPLFELQSGTGAFYMPYGHGPVSLKERLEQNLKVVSLTSTQYTDRKKAEWISHWVVPFSPVGAYDYEDTRYRPTGFWVIKTPNGNYL